MLYTQKCLSQGVHRQIYLSWGCFSGKSICPRGLIGKICLSWGRTTEGLLTRYYHLAAVDFSPWLRDKIWEGPGDEDTQEHCMHVHYAHACCIRELVLPYTPRRRMAQRHGYGRPDRERASLHSKSEDAAASCASMLATIMQWTKLAIVFL